MFSAIKTCFSVSVGLGALIAFVSTVVVLGYAFKIIMFIAAVALVAIFILFLVYALLKEFLFDAIKKPTK